MQLVVKQPNLPEPVYDRVEVNFVSACRKQMRFFLILWFLSYHTQRDFSNIKMLSNIDCLRIIVLKNSNAYNLEIMFILDFFNIHHKEILLTW